MCCVFPGGGNPMDERIALFMPSLAGGGAEKVMLNLGRGMLARGIEVDLVLVSAEGPYLADVPQGINLVDLRARRVLTSLPGLMEYLKERRPKVLLSAQNHANIIALWARRLSGSSARVAVSEHISLGESARNASRWRDRIMPYAVKRFYPWSDDIIAVSRGVAEDLAGIIGLPDHKIHTIYNPVVTPELLEKAEENINHPWFVSDKPPVILGAGRLDRQKDFPTLIRAFAKLRERVPAKLVILGEGPKRTELQSLIRSLGLEDEVDLPGFVNNPYAYMAKAGVFALSSAWEGLATVIIEALACGLPVVSTDCKSGPNEILENGKYGCLVPVGNSQGMANALYDVLAAPHDLQVLRRRAEDFSLDKIVDEYLNVLLAV